MTLRIFCSLILICSLSGCAGLFKSKTKKQKPKEPAIADANPDVSFQSFVGRLRQAVAARDMNVVASMMTSTFGYRLTPIGEGNGVFKFWDENDLWGELQHVVNDRFVPQDDYMVSPPEFASEAQYQGYRAGIRRVNGSWKFAYFVADIPAPVVDAR